jgi:hypothetical protein
MWNAHPVKIIEINEDTVTGMAEVGAPLNVDNF